jgi:hypothetical protein
MKTTSKIGARDESRAVTDVSPLSRREFIARSALAAGTLLLPGEASALAAAQTPKVKVVIVTTKEALKPGISPPLPLVEKMIEKGITLLAGKSDPMQAWATFVRTTDTVCLPTAGGQLENVPEVNIAVYRALARLSVNKMIVGTHRMSDGWHKQVTTAMQGQMPELITDKLFGIANLPMNALIVTPTIKHHDIAGISGTLKLYACFSKKGPWNYHGDSPRYSEHWDGIAGGGMGACGWVPANDFQGIRKLHIVDMLRVGTTSRSWTAYPDGWVATRSLVFSIDPVAADRVAFSLYLKVGQPSGRIDPLYHIERADTEYKAGISDLQKLDIQRATV